jgi:flagellar hook-basal body complex protein FliE
MFRMKTRAFPTAATALLAAFVLQAAQAQAQPGKLVSRDELRTCMNSESSFATRRQALETRNGQNREEAAAIRAEAQELTAEQERIKDDSSKMDRFGRRVKAHNVRIQSANANVESLRADMETLNKALVAYNEQCGGISYSNDDKEAILKERETPAK